MYECYNNVLLIILDLSKHVLTKIMIKMDEKHMKKWKFRKSPFSQILQNPSKIFGKMII